MPWGRHRVGRKRYRGTGDPTKRKYASAVMRIDFSAGVVHTTRVLLLSWGRPQRVVGICRSPAIERGGGSEAAAVNLSGGRVRAPAHGVFVQCVPFASTAGAVAVYSRDGGPRHCAAVDLETGGNAAPPMFNENRLAVGPPPTMLFVGPRRCISRQSSNLPTSGEVTDPKVFHHGRVRAYGRGYSRRRSRIEFPPRTAG